DDVDVMVQHDGAERAVAAHARDEVGAARRRLHRAALDAGALKHVGQEPRAGDLVAGRVGGVDLEVGAEQVHGLRPDRRPVDRGTGHRITRRAATRGAGTARRCARARPWLRPRRRRGRRGTTRRARAARSGAPGLLGGSDASTAAAAAAATILSACAISAWVEARAASAADSACAAASASRRAIRPSSTSCRRVASLSRAWATASSRKGRRSARLARYSRAALTSSDGTGEDAPVTGAPVSASNTSAHAIGRRLIALTLPRVSLDLDGGTPQSYGMTRLLLPDDVVFTCQQ